MDAGQRCGKAHAAGGRRRTVTSGSGALAAAHEAQRRASEAGFDWPDPLGAREKVREEAAEVGSLLGGDPDAALTEEVGDLFFAAVNVARLAGVDPASALAGATRKFRRRYEGVVRLANERGYPMPGTSLEQLDRLWDQVKAAEDVNAPAHSSEHTSCRPR